MSSKGTIFLTKANEHVYEELSDYSIGFEIDKQSIERIELRKSNPEKRFDFYTELLNKDDIEYVFINTKSGDYFGRLNQIFADSFKLKLDDYLDYSVKYDNTPACLSFRFYEIDIIEINRQEIKNLLEIRIYIKTDTEWFTEYVQHLKKCIRSEIQKLDEKLKICQTIEYKG